MNGIITYPSTKEARTITHKAGEIIPFETNFIENPAIGWEPTRTGHFERVEYTTDVYEDGLVHPKYCNVYLPWCYDPADKDRKYNVVYYQHGNTCDPDIFTAEKTKKTIDCLFSSDEIEPVIMVFTTYYFDVTKDVETRKKTGDVPAGDGGYGGGYIAPNYYKEVVKDILPAVETKYNTYTTGPSDEEIRAARDHRAFTGYSRGSVCTWYILHNDFEYFRYYAPMSCHTSCGKKVFDPVTPEEVVEYITGPMKAHPELPFYIFGSNGYPNDVKPMTEQMKFLPLEDIFSFGKDPKVNNLYFALSDFEHDDLYAPWYFYNSLQVLFKH